MRTEAGHEALKEKISRLEKTNREKEALLNHSEKLADIGSFIWDLKTNDLIWSANMYAIHGIREEDDKDHLTAYNRRFIHPEDRNAVARQTKDMIAAGKIWQMQFRIVRPDGEERMIKSNGDFAFDEKGVPVKCMGIYQDVTETHKMERDLANRNSFIETVLEKLPIGVAVTCISTGVSSLINKKFEEVYGWPKSDIPDLKSFFPKVYPDAAYRRKVMKKVIGDVMGGDFSRMRWEELNVTTKKGENRVVSTLTIPFFDQDLMISTAVDITERQQMIASLRESEERYRALFERSFDCVCIYDLEGKFIDGNQAYLNLVEYTREEMTAMDPLSVIDPVSRHDFLKARAALLRKGFEEDLSEYQIASKSGMRKTVEMRRSLIHKDEKPYAIQSFIRDISLRKNIQAELQSTLESLSQAEQIAGLGYFEFNWQTRQYYRSKGLLRILGFSDPEYNETNAAGLFFNLIHDDDRERFLQEIQVFRETGKPLDTEFRIVQKTGNVMWVRAIAKTISDGDNNALLSIGTLQNITVQRHLEEQSRHAQKMESIGTLAGGIAHDFNNILGIILGNAELALEELPETRRYREFISSIQKAGLRGQEVVKQLIDFTRKSDSPYRPMDILPILKESIKRIEPRLGPEIRIIRHLPPAAPPILADAMRIHQLLNNLLANGIDAIENQGEIEISMEKISLGTDMEMPAPDMRPGDYLFMTIKDSGRGIARENLERIFDPYFTTKDIGKGSGLGLSVVHGIIQSHQGFIHVESTPGQGTGISIYFPVLEEIVKAPAPDLEKPAKGSETILYVDDEEALVALGESLLNNLGYTVKGCLDPREALDLFKAAPADFDLIITDLSMPGLTGDELAGEIHRISPQTPIILYSGFTDLMDEKAARKMGIRQFLTKPVDFKTLAHSLREILDNR